MQNAGIFVRSFNSLHAQKLSLFCNILSAAWHSYKKCVTTNTCYEYYRVCYSCYYISRRFSTNARPLQRSKMYFCRKTVKRAWVTIMYYCPMMLSRYSVRNVTNAGKGRGNFALRIISITKVMGRLRTETIQIPNKIHPLIRGRVF